MLFDEYYDISEKVIEDPRKKWSKIHNFVNIEAHINFLTQNLKTLNYGQAFFIFSAISNSQFEKLVQFDESKFNQKKLEHSFFCFFGNKSVLELWSKNFSQDEIQYFIHRFFLFDVNKFKCFDIFKDPVCFSLEKIVKIVCEKENIRNFKENSAFSVQDKDNIKLALDKFFNYDSHAMKIVVEKSSYYKKNYIQ